MTQEQFEREVNEYCYKRSQAAALETPEQAFCRFKSMTQEGNDGHLYVDDYEKYEYLIKMFSLCGIFFKEES